MDVKYDFKLKTCTLNVRGIRSKDKRCRLISWLREKNFDVICLQETFLTPELEGLIKREWQGNIYHSFTSSYHSRGVAILFKPHLDFKCISVYKDCEGRRLLINATINNEHITIANIYAPNELNHRCDFLKRVSTWLKQYSLTPQMAIVCGDFNCSELQSERTSNQTDRSSKIFSDLKSYNSLQDIDKYLNSNDNVSHTWVNPANPSCRSKIDYILASPILANLATKCKTRDAPVPDHKAVIAEFKHINRPRGPGYWKLNVSLLENKQYVDMIKILIHQTTEKYRNVLDHRSLWELIKIKIKEESIRFSSKLAHEKRINKRNIEQEISEIDKKFLNQQQTDQNHWKTKRMKLKNQLNKIYDEKAKGHQIRSRVKWIEEGEKSTSYFLKLEKARQTYNRIDALSMNGGTARTDSEILNEAVSFYKQLYTSTMPSEESIETYLNSTFFPVSLSDHERELCEGKVTLNECTEVVQKLRKNKSPGHDGLPSEFYKMFWGEINTLVIESFNESFEQGELSESQKTAILSLVFKKNDRLNIKNYRPLSLSTTDYKILTFVLTTRLQKVLNTIISSDQSGYMKGRFIGCNMRMVEDIIDYADRANVGGVILFLDFEKAFDSLEWKFMLQCLKKFNFGTQFIKWINILYTDTKIMIKNNGWLSEKENRCRGIRQGCPISALIFILAVEVLALNIKQSSNIRGFPLIDTQNNQKEIRIAQYADDSILILKSDHYIPDALDILSSFSEVSGLKINLDKTLGMWLGIDKNNPNMRYGIKFVNDSVKTLGLYVGHNKDLCYNRNWEDKIEKYQKLIDSWRTRDLTLYGKVLLIKALGISIFVYLAICSWPKKETVAKLSRISYDFLWHKTERIKRNVLINNLEDGGINMIDIESFFMSLQTSWVYRIFQNPESNWQILPRSYLSLLGKNYLALHVNANSVDDIARILSLPPFYQHLIMNFNSINIKDNINTPGDFENQIIWCNKLFKHTPKGSKSGKTINFPHWQAAGLIYIHNLKFKNGMVDEKFIYEKVQNKQNIYVEIKILNMVLLKYRHWFTDVKYNPNAALPNTLNVKLTNKLVYQKLKSKKVESLKMTNWATKLNINFSENIIKKLLISKIQMTVENKLKEFNYKVITNILSCNHYLAKWKQNVSGLCEICNVNDDILHLLCNCKLAKTIWTKVQVVLDRQITAQDILFGINESVAINQLFSITAFTIYKYWIQTEASNNIRSEAGLLSLIKADFRCRIEVYNTLQYHNVAHLMQAIIRAL